ncbi:haloacid dehalogenase type II [Rhodococcus sp. IEGM 1381]|uniref:haloacid dehalogenase type II n=1 Tax=Rhodococcus sp. IEGM 1381 TaxID=3047085 RepID=UPI0024B77163|nr:haloacid dehalogenase type II [Rhodococcus sp. IEGM 1381]MDI9893568.1 haloacid dehalogenase type II [Rhodococcus sp. IEGM 1381]
MNLADYDVLSFDCYGTLIDWEAGILNVLTAWAEQSGAALSQDELLAAFGANESRVQQDSPSMLYPAILAEAFVRTGDALGIPVSAERANRLGSSVPDWPAFADSAEALASLAENYKLVILSNVHREGFAGSNRRLGVQFDAIVTAEDVGAYKPSDNHFDAIDGVLDHLGVPRSRLLHVAQSLFHDHVPAKRHGIASVWIDRRHDRPGWGATPEPTEKYSFDMKFPSMAAFATAAGEASNDA